MRGTGTVLWVSVLALLGCSPRGRVEPNAEPGVVDAQRLDGMLDRLEERLLASQTKVALWAELRDRHGEVAEVACRNLSEHARAIALFDGRQREKRTALRKGRIATRFDLSAVNHR